MKSESRVSDNTTGEETMITKTATIGGVKFAYLSRAQGDLIIIDGKRGFAWSSVDGHEAEAKGVAGVYHYAGGVSTLIPGVDVAEFRAAMM